MADDAGGKSSKKNAKRQAARARKRLLEESDPSPVAATPAAGASASAARAPANTSGRIGTMRVEMAEAKARGDHRKAQEIREQIWVLNDQAAGQMGEGFERVVAKMDSTVPEKTPGKVELTDSEKRLRALNKKLQQIEKIKTAVKEGQNVESGQLQRLETETEVRDEITEIEKLLSTL